MRNQLTLLVAHSEVTSGLDLGIFIQSHLLGHNAVLIPMGEGIEAGA